MSEPRIIFCPYNHIYDAVINSSCPYCKKIKEEQQALGRSVAEYVNFPIIKEDDDTELIDRDEADEYTELLLTPLPVQSGDDEHTELLRSENPQYDAKERCHRDVESIMEEKKGNKPDEIDCETQGKLIGWFVIKKGVKKGHSIELLDNTKCLGIAADGQIIASPQENNVRAVLYIDKERFLKLVPIRGTPMYVNGKIQKTEVFLRPYDEVSVDSFQLAYVELMSQFLGWGD